MIIQLLAESAGGIVVLAVALWLVSSRDDNPYKEKGLLATLLRCVVLVVGFRAFDLIIWHGAKVIGDASLEYVGMAMVTAAWFVGVMFFFERTFLQAILVTAAMLVLRILTPMAMKLID